MSEEYTIAQAVKIVEEYVEQMYHARFGDTPKPPVLEMYKAGAMSEVGRQVSKRAHDIEEDWAHFTRN